MSPKSKKEVEILSKESLEAFLDAKIYRLKPIPTQVLKIKKHYLEELRYSLIIKGLRDNPVKSCVSEINQAILEMDMILNSKIKE